MYILLRQEDITTIIVEITTEIMVIITEVIEEIIIEAAEVTDVDKTENAFSKWEGIFVKNIFLQN